MLLNLRKCQSLTLCPFTLWQAMLSGIVHNVVIHSWRVAPPVEVFVITLIFWIKTYNQGFQAELLLRPLQRRKNNGLSKPVLLIVHIGGLITLKENSMSHEME